MLECIENDMARLMNRSARSLPSKTPDYIFPPVVEKVIAIIDRFIGKYGLVLFEIFRLSTFPRPNSNVTSIRFLARSNVTGSSLLIPGNISPQSQPIT